MQGLDLASRIRALEAQIAKLRAEALGTAEALPTHAFTGLHVGVADAWFVVPVKQVREAVSMVWCDPVPEAPPWVVGTFHYRGETRFAIDLKQRLFGERSGKSAGLVLIVLRNSRAALVADRIGALEEIEPGRLSPPPTGISYAPFLIASLPGVNGQVLQVLSAARLSREYVLASEAGDGT